MQLLLEKGADLSVRNEGGETALNFAAWSGHEPTVQLLLEKGADLSIQDFDGNTALHQASYEGHEAVV